MAKPIALTPRPHDPREEEQKQLQSAPVEHAEAILSAYKTLQTLHDSGTLDILRGVAGASDHLIGQLSAGLNTPEIIRGLRNLLTLSKLLGNIEPDLLEAIASSVSEAIDKSRKESPDPPSTWEILKRSRSEDSRRTQNAVVNILEAVGRELRDAKAKPGS